MKDELPGVLELAKGVADDKLSRTMDAAVWAEEFMNVYNSGVKIDEGFMIAWFANAIMAGYDTACMRKAEASM